MVHFDLVFVQKRIKLDELIDLYDSTKEDDIFDEILIIFNNELKKYCNYTINHSLYLNTIITKFIAVFIKYKKQDVKDKKVIFFLVNIYLR